MTTTDASTESVPEASAELVSPTDVGGRGLTDRQAKILPRLLRAAYPHSDVRLRRPPPVALPGQRGS